jgi:putative Ca2+/H+ antiporter (TMEM165/GDT1 family)
MVQAQISDAFIALFLAQVLTFATGLLSLAVKRIRIRIIPFLSSITVTVLMNHTYSAAVTHSLSIYQPEYWFMYPSIFLFLYAFGLSLATKKRQTAHLQEEPSHS